MERKMTQVKIDDRISDDQKEKLIEAYKAYDAEAFTCDDDPQHMEFACEVHDICGIMLGNYDQVNYLIDRIKLWADPLVRFSNGKEVN